MDSYRADEETSQEKACHSLRGRLKKGVSRTHVGRARGSGSVLGNVSRLRHGRLSG